MYSICTNIYIKLSERKNYRENKKTILKIEKIFFSIFNNLNKIYLFIIY